MPDPVPTPDSSLLLFQSEDGVTHIDVRLQGETVWLSQKQMAELYQVTPSNINQHLRRIFEERELEQDAVVKHFLITATDQKQYTTMHYNLDAILAVGYRVRSHRGAQFRRWATRHLREFLVKGFVMDDQRLKDMRAPFGSDYFDELLERIRDIRSSEKRFYRKITDIYATSIDYDPSSEQSQIFFATVQNKLHWAIHGHTAAELIQKRADAARPNMGLTNWKGSKVRKDDVTVAKNYLDQEELASLSRIVTMYLDYAEDQAQRHNPMHMEDWVDKLNGFLEFNGREVLDNPGTVSKAVADRLARETYDSFHSHRLEQEAENEDDFDRAVKAIDGS